MNKKDKIVLTVNNEGEKTSILFNMETLDKIRDRVSSEVNLLGLSSEEQERQIESRIAREILFFL